MEDVFKLIDQQKNENGTVLSKLEILWDSKIFAGHFPGFPILPGALMIDLSYKLCNATIDTKGRSFEVKRIKFHNPVLPDDTKHFVVETIENSPSVFNVEIQNENGTKLFSGVVAFTK
jgi:3-hydroxymyristoyl/3-hydroxydecanoyl-(acyl carrier protein) dehydratase